MPCSASCYLTFFWLAKQATNKLANGEGDFMSNGENTDNFTALYTLYLSFTFGTNSMQASSRAHGIFVHFLAFFYELTLFKFWVKDTARTTDHAQIT